MQSRSLEQRLAPHCAPTLLGAKAASLLSLPRQEFPELALLLRGYNRTLYSSGVRFLILWEYSERYLVLVYRPTMLRNSLLRDDVHTLLHSLSYPDTDCLGKLLTHLKRRFSETDDFPHEIGLFLDYPPADVKAFMDGSAECKLCGYWKVYCNVEAAREKFACYDACRTCVCNLLRAGGSFSQLLQAA